MKRLITTVFVMGMFLTTVALADDVDSKLSSLPPEIAPKTRIVPKVCPRQSNSSSLQPTQIKLGGIFKPDQPGDVTDDLRRKVMPSIK